MPFHLLSLFCGLMFGLLSPALGAPMPTQRPAAGEWRPQSEAFGHVAAWADSHLRLSFPLRVTARRITPGQTVKKGDPLLHFQAPRIVQDLTGYLYARHKSQLATRWADTLRHSDKGKMVPRHDLLTALRDAASAEAAQSDAWDRLYADLSELGRPPLRKEMNERLKTEKDVPRLAKKLGVLRAPFAGVVLDRPPAAGAWVEPGTPLIEVEDLTRV